MRTHKSSKSDQWGIPLCPSGHETWTDWEWISWPVLFCSDHGARIPHRTVVWPGAGPVGAWESPAEQARAAATAGRTRPLILLETLLSSSCKAQSSTCPWKVCQEALDKILSLRGIMGMALDTGFPVGSSFFNPLWTSALSPPPPGGRPSAQRRTESWAQSPAR